MMLFLKIISFPVRLVLALICALLGVLIMVAAQIIGVVFVLASYIASTIVKILVIGVAAVLVVALYDKIFHPNGYDWDNISFLQIFIALGICALLFGLISFLPAIVDTIYEFLLVAPSYVFGFAKYILFLRTEKQVKKRPEKALDTSEPHYNNKYFVELKRKAALKNMQEMSIALNTLSELIWIQEKFLRNVTNG